MAILDKIEVKIVTRDVPNAGTDGEVYLGIGGREFRLNNLGNQFKKGQTDNFTIGVGSNINNSKINDLPQSAMANPDSPVIDSGPSRNAAYPPHFPVYIRLDSKGDTKNDWNIEQVVVDANEGTQTPGTFVFPNTTNPPPPKVHPEGSIWLGINSGEILFLESV